MLSSILTSSFPSYNVENVKSVLVTRWLWFKNKISYAGLKTNVLNKVVLTFQLLLLQPSSRQKWLGNFKSMQFKLVLNQKCLLILLMLPSLWCIAVICDGKQSSTDSLSASKFLTGTLKWPEKLFWNSHFDWSWYMCCVRD